MKVEHPAELSEVLQGIFFLDGNVLPDDCLTVYSSDWNADQLRLLLRVFDPVIWTFHSSMGGRMLVYLVKFSRFTYLFRFSDATLQHGHITPIVFGWSVPQHSSQFKDVWQMSRGFEKRLEKNWWEPRCCSGKGAMINLTRGFRCCLRMPKSWFSGAAKYLTGSVVIPFW